MGQGSKIEWTDATWNPTRGCSRVSPGCVHCYAERIASRFSKDDLTNHNEGDQPFFGFATKVNGHPAWTGKVELITDKLTEPLHWRKPRRIFVNSMSDLFHEALPYEQILLLFLVMGNGHIATGHERTHQFQILTKRSARMRDFCNRLRWRTGIAVMELAGEPLMFNNMPYLDTFDPWVSIQNGGPVPPKEQPAGWMPPQIWLGVSVEDRARKDRIEDLRHTPAAVRFLSIEPLLEDIGELDLRGISWVIVGGESGPSARPFDIAWARSIIRQSKAASVPCFVKQLGADAREGNANGNCRNLNCTHPDCGYVHISLRDPKGGDWAEWPENLRVREFPRGAGGVLDGVGGGATAVRFPGVVSVSVVRPRSPRLGPPPRITWRRQQQLHERRSSSIFLRFFLDGKKGRGSAVLLASVRESRALFLTHTQWEAA